MNKSLVVPLLVGFCAVLIFGLLTFYVANDDVSQDSSINSFDECVAAGYPVQMSYPGQCSTSDGQTFVDEVNGKKIRSLHELANAFAEAPEHLVIRMIGDGPPLVLDRNKVEAARERIKTRYNVVKEQNLQERPESGAARQANKT